MASMQQFNVVHVTFRRMSDRRGGCGRSPPGRPVGRLVEVSKIAAATCWDWIARGDCACAWFFSRQVRKSRAFARSGSTTSRKRLSRPPGGDAHAMNLPDGDRPAVGRLSGLGHEPRSTQAAGHRRRQLAGRGGTGRGPTRTHPPVRRRRLSARLERRRTKSLRFVLTILKPGNTSCVWRIPRSATVRSTCR